MLASCDMRTTITLSDLTDQCLASMRSNAYKRNTILSHGRGMRHFLAHVGNLQVRHITPGHVDSYFTAREALGMKPNTLNSELMSLRHLFKFAYQRGYLGGRVNPVEHRRPYPVPDTERHRVSERDFDRLLDAAKHPRDRIAMALGLNLLLRASEMKELRVGWVDLPHRTIQVRVSKGPGKLDNMPISSELEQELLTWLTWYAEHVGEPLRPEWYLVPAKTEPALGGGKVDLDAAKLRPTAPFATTSRIIQAALASVGVPLRDEHGDSTREGMHTLRRSAARALFEKLSDDGYDRPLRMVQAMLHHASVTITETYLGVGADQLNRDKLIRGKPMFRHAKRSDGDTAAPAPAVSPAAETPPHTTPKGMKS